MTDLVAAIRAAIDETEQIARYSGGTGGWVVGECVDAEDGRTTEWLIVEGNYPVARVRGNMRANHVARHDTSAVLRRCAADRKILDGVQRYLDPHPGQPCTNVDNPWTECELHTAAKGRISPEVLPILAGVYDVEA